MVLLWAEESTTELIHVTLQDPWTRYFTSVIRHKSASHYTWLLLLLGWTHNFPKLIHALPGTFFIKKINKTLFSFFQNIHFYILPAGFAESHLGPHMKKINEKKCISEDNLRDPVQRNQFYKPNGSCLCLQLNQSLLEQKMLHQVFSKEHL